MSKKKFLVMILALGTILVFGAVTALAAGPWYVDINYPSAVDANYAGSQNTPFASLSYALSIAGSGETIYVDDGLYDTDPSTGATANVESFPIPVVNETIQYKNFHADSGGDNGAIFDASSDAFDVTGSATISGDDPATTPKETKLKITGASGTGEFGLDISGTGATVSYVEVYGNETGISCTGAGAFTLEYSNVHDNTKNGLFLNADFTADAITIQENTFSSNGDAVGEAGINFGGGTTLDPTGAVQKIYHNTFSANQNAIYFAALTFNSSPIQISFNAILDDNTAGVNYATATPANVEVDYNWWGAASGPGAGFNTNVTLNTGVYLGHPLKTISDGTNINDTLSDVALSTWSTITGAGKLSTFAVAPVDGSVS